MVSTFISSQTGKKESKESEENDDDKDKEKKEKKKKKKTIIDLSGFEHRIVLLPPAHGSYRSVSAVSGKVLFTTGDSEFKYYDLKKREEKSIIKGIRRYQLSADGKKILIKKDSSWYIISPNPDQKADKALPVNDMQMVVNPKEEWRSDTRQVH